MSTYYLGVSPREIFDQQRRSGTRPVLWLRLSIAVLVGAVLAFAYVARFHQDILLGHTLCPVLATTGYKCPLCGGSQSVVSLVHGDWWMAADANLLVALGPVLLVLGLTAKRAWNVLPAQRRRIEVVATFFLPVAFALWWLLRNLYGL